MQNANGLSCNGARPVMAQFFAVDLFAHSEGSHQCNLKQRCFRLGRKCETKPDLVVVGDATALVDSSCAIGSVQIAHGDFLDIDIGPNHFWLGFLLGDRMSGHCRCGGVTKFHLDSTCRTDPVIKILVTTQFR